MKTTSLLLLIAYIKNKYNLRDIIFDASLNCAGDYNNKSRIIRLNPLYENKDITLLHELGHMLLLNHPQISKFNKYGIGSNGCYTTEYLCEWFAWYIHFEIKHERARNMALSYVNSLERENKVVRKTYMKSWLKSITNHLKNESIQIKKAYREYQ